ncbi:MAG: efflux transporter outer membrane subunit [Dokdonella sp.]
MRRAFLSAISLTLAVGCAPPLPNVKPDVNVPQHWSQATSVTATDAPVVDLRGWWRAFGDSQLDRLVDAALAENLDVQQAQQRIVAARALQRRERAAYRPSLSAKTESNPTPDSSASYFQAGFDAQWELGLFGRSESDGKIARADFESAEVDLQAARASVVAEVARTYVELRGADQRIAAFERIVEAQREKLGFTKTREHAQLASALDVARVESDLAQAETAAIEPRLTITRSRQQLALLSGRAESIALSDGAQPTLGDLRIEQTPADLLRTRPDIRRAEFAVLKAAGEAGLARADLYPRLGLGGALTYSSRISGTTRLGNTNSIFSIGPVIDIPLFDWGARRAVVDARDAALQAALLGYRQAVLEGVAEVEIALASLEQQRLRVSSDTRSLAAQKNASAATATLVHLQLADGIDNSDAKIALDQAAIESEQASEARNLAFIALYKALGGAPLADMTQTTAAPGDSQGQAIDARPSEPQP